MNTSQNIRPLNRESRSKKETVNPAYFFIKNLIFPLTTSLIIFLTEKFYIKSHSVINYVKIIFFQFYIFVFIFLHQNVKKIIENSRIFSFPIIFFNLFFTIYSILNIVFDKKIEKYSVLFLTINKPGILISLFLLVIVVVFCCSSYLFSIFVGLTFERDYVFRNSTIYLVFLIHSFICICGETFFIYYCFLKYYNFTHILPRIVVICFVIIAFIISIYKLLKGRKDVIMSNFKKLIYILLTIFGIVVYFIMVFSISPRLLRTLDLLDDAIDI
ncbi:hypothetical protein LUQ84_3603 [Hamiltosporidium tvaerminnensis]|nr:hypothetical protein LUQ84_3603 [Hamiltosporidium tvaerminnensis]